MPQPFRLIVIANRTCPCPGLAIEVASLLGERPGEVLVVAPALNTRLRHFMTDDKRAIAAARERLDLAVMLLGEAGIDGRGEIGDADPLNAIADAHATFGAEAVLISTWPEGMSHWLERDLLGRARKRVEIPVHHVVSAFDAPVGSGTAA